MRMVVSGEKETCLRPYLNRNSWVWWHAPVIPATVGSTNKRPALIISRPYLENNQSKRVGGVAQGVDYLPSNVKPCVQTPVWGWGLGGGGNLQNGRKYLQTIYLTRVYLVFIICKEHYNSRKAQFKMLKDLNRYFSKEGTLLTSLVIKEI
jgi:hypothetical protein